MMKKEKIINIITVLLLLSIIPIIVYSLTTQPYADDLLYTELTSKYLSQSNWNIFGLLKAALETDIYYYNNWQGLYSSAFILSLEPGIFNEKIYWIGSLLLMIILYFCVFSFTKSFCKILKLDNITFAISNIIFIVLMLGMPDIYEGIYWFNGAWNYTFFFALTILNISLIFNYTLNSNKKYLYVILSCVISLIISGGNHVTSFLNIIVLFIFVVFGIIKKKYDSIPSFLCAVAGFIFMYIAPGTAIRKAQFNKQGITSTIISSCVKCYLYLTEWINFQWIMYVFIIIIVCLLFIKNDQSYKKINPIYLFILSFATLSALLCVPWYAMGGFGEGRLTNVIWFAFIIFTFINIVNCYLWFNPKFEIKTTKLLITIFGLISLLMIINSNSNFYTLIYNSIM